MSGKPFPHLNSDDEAERFVAEADLSEYDFSKGRWVRLNFADGSEHESAAVDLPRAEMEVARQHAEREGISLNSYLGRLVHESLERLAS